MYPDENQYSIDYLNQIAPAAKKPGMSNKLMIIIISLGVALVLIVGLMVFSSSSAGPTQDMETLAARLQTLQTISDSSQKTIKSSNLRSTNSTLTLFLTNANRDIVTPLAKNQVDVKKLSKTIVAAENGSKLTATLENARLNAVYDGTYAREMSYQLATVVALMKKIYTSSSSKSMKDFLNSTDSNLQPIKNQFDTFNPVND
jgi:uncharacterized protein YpmB